MKLKNTSNTLKNLVTTATMAIMLGLLLTPAAIAAEPTTTTDFRVDNGIFQLPEKTPLTRTVTVFRDGLVYDFMLESEKITIFDELQGTFTLIDADKGAQTVIPMQFINKALERLATHAAKKDDPETKFFYNPQFKPTQKDTTTGELIFESPWLTYRVDAKQGDVKAAKQYARFADAYAKLNTVLHPGSKPPFARMQVNRTLAASTMLPKVVLVTKGAESDPDAPQFSSEHRYEMKLDENDQKRIDDVKASLEKLKVVTFEEFQKL